MADPADRSTAEAAPVDALEQALTRSGLLRTAGVIIVMAASLAAMTLRRRAFPEADQAAFTLGPMALTGAFLVYEVALFGLLLHRLRRHRPVSGVVWVVNSAVECSLPTAAMAVVWSLGLLGAAPALVAPAMLAYLFFIVLSILQLRPWITALNGGLCGGQHLALVLVANARGDLAADDVGLPFATLLMYGPLLMLAGACASFVAIRVRRYVEVAIAEATRRDRAERELGAARRVQRSVLPGRPPDLAGYAVAGWNRQAAQAGGDYYDWQALPDGRVFVSVADVAGHGLGPALLTAYCRAYARSSMQETGSLASAIARLDALVTPDLPEGRFVTFAGLLLAPDRDEVELLSAGHGPILVHRAASGSVERRDADLLPLGVDADEAPGAASRLRLGAGDVMLIVTDGFFEWSNEHGEAWGIERLRKALAAHAAEPPGRLIETLVREVEAFSGSTPQADDLTAVAIRRGP